MEGLCATATAVRQDGMKDTYVWAAVRYIHVCMIKYAVHCIDFVACFAVHLSVTVLSGAVCSGADSLPDLTVHHLARRPGAVRMDISAHVHRMPALSHWTGLTSEGNRCAPSHSLGAAHPRSWPLSADAGSQCLTHA